MFCCFAMMEVKIAVAGRTCTRRDSHERVGASHLIRSTPNNLFIRSDICARFMAGQDRAGALKLQLDTTPRVQISKNTMFISLFSPRIVTSLRCSKAPYEITRESGYL